MSGRTIMLQPVQTYIFTNKTHKTKVKQAVISLYKHVKTTNDSLNVVVTSVRRSSVIV